MQNKKSFLSGIFVGVIAVIAINTVYSVFALSPFGMEQMSVETKIKTIYSILDNYYVEDYDKEATEEGLYMGLVYGVGDPWTSYMDKETLNTFMEHTEGTYAGIGIAVTIDETDNTILVVAPYEGSPGEKAGILPGDKIIKVNGSPVSGDILDETVALMKGEPGTSVDVTILREKENNKTMEMTINREQIDIPTVSYELLKNDIGYIRISNFERVTYEQFVNALQDLLDQGIQGLVLDVRNNPGGLVSTVTQIADIFIPEGNIVYMEDKHGNREDFNASEEYLDIPLAVLINGSSASASEVLAGAVQDRDRGALVGTQTFGKGLVQNLYPLKDGSAIKVTIQKYYTPNGVCIHGEGLTPDYVVELDEGYGAYAITSLTYEEDTQLQQAVEVVTLEMATR